jgi:RimJ/RimL family protein N-acetyltransferase
MDAMQWIQTQSDEKRLLNFCIEYQGKVAGSIGVMPKEDVYSKTIELGYFIGEPFWGKGIGAKAVGLMIGYIEKEFDVVRIFAEVFEHNKASMKILMKNGFHLEGIRKQSVIKDGIIMDDYVWVRLLNK